jgi:RHS repeat-associated protein
MLYQLGTTTVGNLSYSYDALGRRIQMDGSLANTGFPTAVSSASYDATNQVTNWNGTTISYDNNGNITSDGASSYSWNARNRLSGISGAFSASFAYDGYGRRTGKTVGSQSTGFAFNGDSITQEIVGGSVAANILTGHFQRTDSSGTTVPIHDVMGSVVALADGSGSLVTQYTYDPFGGTTASGTSSTNAYQYIGQQNDGTGLYYLHARYYSPGLHRFISEDPMGFGGGSTNLHNYGYDSPTNLKDPSGRSPCLVGGLLGTIGYNGYVIYQTLHGRKINKYSGWGGLWNLAAGNAQAFGMGCAIASGAGAGYEAAANALADEAGAAAEEVADVAAEEAETGANDIDIGQRAFDHVIESHTAGGADAAGNSIFSGDAQDVANLIQNADLENADVFWQEWNGNTVYANYSAETVGYSPAGQYTNVYSIVVNGSGELVTAFPGFPY